MARTISQIQKQINQEIQSDSVLSPLLTSTSQTALWNLFTFVVAVSIALFEQLQDVFKVQIETEINAQPPGTPDWITKEMLAFQYSTGDPQVVQFTNGVPAYPIINTNLQVIKHCAIDTTTVAPGRVAVKCATADPTTPLTQQVYSVTVTAAGSGFTTAPLVTIKGGGPSAKGATITLPAPPYTVGQVITATTGGSGFVETPIALIDIFGTGGSGLKLQVNIDSQLAAAQAYIDVIGFAGIRYELSSLANDWLIFGDKFGAADGMYVQFDAQYTFGLIRSNVTSAIQTYLTTLPFDGLIILSDLMGAIKSVPGVIDVDFKNLVRTDNTYGSELPLVGGSTVYLPQVNSIAGIALYEPSLSKILYQTNPLS